MKKIILNEFDTNKIVIDELRKVAEYSEVVRIDTILDENYKIKYTTYSKIFSKGKTFPVIGKIKTSLYFRLLKNGLEDLAFEVKYVHPFYKNDIVYYEIGGYAIFNKNGFSKTLRLDL